MIKLIIFDLSDVCFIGEESIYLDYFAKKHKIDRKELDDFYMPLVNKSEKGKISGKMIWKKVLKKFRLKDNINQIIKDMMKIRKPYKTIEIAKKLKKSFKTAYLTNYNQDYWVIANKRFSLTPYFDYGIVSYQIKARKPDKRGFLKIMKHFNVKPDETLFIDDSRKNVEKAKEIGINAIPFKNPKRLEKDLKEIKLL